MRVLYLDEAGQLLQLQQLPADIKPNTLPASGCLWLDLAWDDGPQAIEALLATRFGFHPLAVDDALHETHLPKLDDWDNYLYLVLQDISFDGEQGQVVLPELDVFLGPRYLVTYHRVPLPALDRVWETSRRATRWLQLGANNLLYRIIDELVNNYAAVLESMEEEIARLENEIFADPDSDLLERLSRLKRMVLHVRRVLAPQREVVNKLARDDFPFIRPRDGLYFRDVYDHLVRLFDRSDGVRDLVLGSMEIYLSVVNNRMNEVMKTLTLITTLFMPLTFLTGFFGMNFFQATAADNFWTGSIMLGLVLLAMGVLPLLMLWWMRRRAWM